MKLEPTFIDGAYVLHLEPRGDERGFFARVFCSREFSEVGLVTEFVQFNSSLSTRAGTLRGMHYQTGASAETKLVRCIRGAIYDVAIDLREQSRTFGASFGVLLNESNRDMFYVPKGCAHGYLTLEASTEVLYFVDNFYDPNAEEGIRFDDPAFGVSWPFEPIEVSEKDRSWNPFDVTLLRNRKQSES